MNVNFFKTLVMPVQDFIRVVMRLSRRCPNSCPDLGWHSLVNVAGNTTRVNDKIAHVDNAHDLRSSFDVCDAADMVV